MEDIHLKVIFKPVEGFAEDEVNNYLHRTAA